MRAMFSSIIVLLVFGGLARTMQNDAKDFEVLKPPVVFTEGFFDLEKLKDSTWRWMGDRLPKAEGPVPLKGTILLLNSKKDSVLTINAMVPLNSTPAPPTIKFFFNGERLDEFTATKDRLEKSYKIPATKQGPDEYSELVITTDQFAIPMEHNKASNDSRRLGLRLTKLTWAGNEGNPPIVEAPKPVIAVPMEIKSETSSLGGWIAFVIIAVVVFLLVLAFAVYLARRTNEVAEDAA